MKNRLPSFILKMNKRIVLYIISAILNFLLLLSLSIIWVSFLTGNNYDIENVWRIYLESHVLHIGQFWASVFLIWYPLKGVNLLLDNIIDRLDSILKVMGIESERV